MHHKVFICLNKFMNVDVISIISEYMKNNYDEIKNAVEKMNHEEQIQLTKYLGEKFDIIESQKLCIINTCSLYNIGYRSPHDYMSSTWRCCFNQIEYCQDHFNGIYCSSCDNYICRTCWPVCGNCNEQTKTHCEYITGECDNCFKSLCTKCECLCKSCYSDICVFCINKCSYCTNIF